MASGTEKPENCGSTGFDKCPINTATSSVIEYPRVYAV
jgi:hypothetical protein